jgi:glutamyl-tRNA synthetase
MTAEFSLLKEKLGSLEQWNLIELKKEFRAVAENLKIKAKELVHPTRVALSGRTFGAGLFETLLEVLGKLEILSRIDRLLKYWGR